MTTEQREQAVKLLATGLYVWRVAKIKRTCSGRISILSRALIGQGIDGCPITVRQERGISLILDGAGRVAIMGGNALVLRLDEKWNTAQLDRLAQALNGLSCRQLDALAEALRREG